LSDIFPQGKLDSAKVFKINLLSSVVLKNSGHRKLEVKVLPKAAQASMVNGIVVDDLQKSGHKDILLVGNFYPFRVQFGPLDAGIGLILRENGKGDFSSLGYAETGLKIDGDVRNLVKVNGANGNYYMVAAKSDGAVQILKRNN
jgi:hypothetical protein